MDDITDISLSGLVDKCFALLQFIDGVASYHQDPINPGQRTRHAVRVTEVQIHLRHAHLRSARLAYARDQLNVPCLTEAADDATANISRGSSNQDPFSCHALFSILSI